MYVLTYDDQVFLGPMDWNNRMFQSVILDDYNRKVIIPANVADKGKYVVDSNIVIRPVVFQSNPAYNPKIQALHGPFYVMQQDNVLSSNIVVDLPINAVKNTLKAAVTAARYTKEVAGFVTTIQNAQVFIPTDRSTRTSYFHEFQLGSNNVKWKFAQGSVPTTTNTTPGRRNQATTIKETWLVLTTADFESIAQQVAAYVSSTFDWEHTALLAIDACTTLAELNDIVVTP